MILLSVCLSICHFFPTQNFADSRVRVKGRFVKKEDEAILMEVNTLTSKEGVLDQAAAGAAQQEQQQKGGHQQQVASSPSVADALMPLVESIEDGGLEALLEEGEDTSPVLRPSSPLSLPSFLDP